MKKQNVCKRCNEKFYRYQKINGKRAHLTNRRYCLNCKPYKSNLFKEEVKKYSKEKLNEIIKKSTSYAEVLKRLEMKPSGGNQQTLKKYILKHGINISHFLHQAWKRGKTSNNKVDIEEYLSNKRPIYSHPLKLKLIKEGYFDHKCYKCNLTEWQGEKIPIQLHHIDGNSSNNNLDNLIILCPNCHALTDTFCGKNTSLKNNCTKCNIPIRKSNSLCHKCNKNQAEVEGDDPSNGY